MAQHDYKVGDIVEVYGDPISKLLSQGKAKIVSLMEVDNYYIVIFTEDPDVEVGRFIYKRSKKNG